MKTATSLALALLLACAPAAGNRADVLPEVVGDAHPFRYPVGLYEQGVEGDVTLRLHVDTAGRVVTDSIHVAESSGEPLLDSAAVQGAPALQFRPATLGGRPVPLTVLFPVRFRVPPERRAANDTGTRPGRP